MGTSGSETMLEARNLTVNFRTYRGEVKALDRVDLSLFGREVLALVGESGCGKSVTALAILGLLPTNAYVLGGQILFRGNDLLKKSADEMRAVRAEEIAAIFQDPMTFLNPVLTIGVQLKEAFLVQKELTWSEAAEDQTKSGGPDRNIRDFLLRRHVPNAQSGIKVSGRKKQRMAQELSKDILNLVRLPDPERILTQYPHELSGGMRQRCMIAMALARRPSILIADEITTALDVTVQAQILTFLKELRDTIEQSLTTLLITHDLSIAAETADRITVMYAGNVVEVAPTKELFRKALHPYTQLLMKCIPDVRKPVIRLESITGSVPDLIEPPTGCRFHPRCPFVMKICSAEKPVLKDISDGHSVHCHLY
jgi:oligopeptide/dipeptide ABC transporter ATP-binding protein